MQSEDRADREASLRFELDEQLNASLQKAADLQADLQVRIIISYVDRMHVPRFGNVFSVGCNLRLRTWIAGSA